MDIRQTSQSKRSDHPECKWERGPAGANCLLGLGRFWLPKTYVCACACVCVGTHAHTRECAGESVSPALPSPACVLMMSRRFHGTFLECSSAVHQAKLENGDREMTGLKRYQGSSRLTSQTELVLSFHNSKDTSYQTAAMGTYNSADPVRTPLSCFLTIAS